VSTLCIEKGILADYKNANANRARVYYPSFTGTVRIPFDIKNSKEVRELLPTVCGITWLEEPKI